MLFVPFVQEPTLSKDRPLQTIDWPFTYKHYKKFAHTFIHNLRLQSHIFIKYINEQKSITRIKFERVKQSPIRCK